MDFGKFQYQQEKKLQKQKKFKVGGLKEIRLGLKTSPHDQEIKIERAKKFLSQKQKVRINLRLMGREAMFKDKGFEVINDAASALSEYGEPEGRPQKERNIISVTISPK